MSSIHSFGSNLIKAYVNVQANPSILDAEKTKKMQDEMGIDDDEDKTPEEKAEKFILEQTTNVSEELKQLMEEMKKQQAKLLALGQSAAGEKAQTELDQKNEIAENQAQSAADFMARITKHDLTNALNQVLSDDSENADAANVDLVAELTNMIAEKGSTTTVVTEA